MNLLVLLTSHPSAAVIAQVSSPADQQPIGLQTAVLIIIGVAVIFSWKAIVDLRRRLDDFARVAVSNPPSAFPPPTSATAMPSVKALPSPELLAVIAVAVHVVIQAPHRVVSVQPFTSENHAWSIDGRRRIFESHKTR